jgi:ribosome-binding protein aMBF1 (putative translation factor)
VKKRSSRKGFTLGPAGRRLQALHMRTRADRESNEQERVFVEVMANLAAAMERQGVSPAQLAQRMRVKRSVVSKLTQGDRRIQVGTIAAAFHALGLSMHITYGLPSDAPQIVRGRLRT